ncbi:MAG: hypothetical protein D6698_09290 [Gammaproteobacteria bacterium]|nr:MAG: hypothetical protein D6698_09290 [Gammaproteobacteria bacterium]
MHQTSYDQHMPYIILLIILLIASPTNIHAQTCSPHIVPDLPPDNLIQNPWFRNPTSSQPNQQSSLQSWSDMTPAYPDHCFTHSQKCSNDQPLPSSLANGANEPTSARWTNGIGQGYSNPDQCHNGGSGGLVGRLEQVVQAHHPQDTQLTFDMYWVRDNVTSATVKIYGSDQPTGPWTTNPVWIAWDQADYPLETPSQSGYAEGIFHDTPPKSTVLNNPYPYYKIVIEASYRPDANRGFKFTGVYFSTSSPDNPPPNPDKIDFLDYLNHILSFNLYSQDLQKIIGIFDINNIIKQFSQ